jgi:hypothetical protein
LYTLSKSILFLINTALFKVRLISGYEFSKYDLFSSYIDYFYEIKKNSTGPLKFIAKLLLNTLYGIFGRKQELIQTINIHPSEFEKYAICM